MDFLQNSLLEKNKPVNGGSEISIHFCIIHNNMSSVCKYRSSWIFQQDEAPDHVTSLHYVMFSKRKRIFRLKDALKTKEHVMK